MPRERQHPEAPEPNGKVKAKKFLGQHFLHDRQVAQRIAQTLPPDTRNVLEIGPGMGILTRYLLEVPGMQFKVVEIDRESVAYLHNHFPALQEKIIEADFLRLPLEGLFEAPFWIIGNFPYNISSQILFRMYDNPEIITGLSGMFQREVARRIASPPGSREYGILSVLLGAYYDCEYLFTVDEHVFSPPPKVKSGVIRLVRKTQEETLVPDKPQFTALVKTAFNQRRKTLKNALSVYRFADNHRTSGLLSHRAEQLSYQDFIELSSLLQH